MNPNNRDFFELVKAIGESKSKQEEDRIVTDEIVYLKKKISEAGIHKKKLKEFVVRALYVEMLGQDASFAYIKAVELCASNAISQKRVGYLAASLCLSPDHEFRFMLVNQIQRDMKSSNQLESCAALSAAAVIITADMIPAVIGEVWKLLSHEMGTVRRKAACCIHKFYTMDNACVKDNLEKIRRLLCDKDPSVMAAGLVIVLALAKDDPKAYKDLVSVLASILKQITENRLSSDYDYHRIPAPWIQLNLLRLMAILGRGDQISSEGMYEVLGEVIRKADTGANAGYAIVYEAVRTVTAIYPSPVLLDIVAAAVSRFMRSDSHNLKYIGIKGLAAIVKDHPRYALDHQMAVIDCLEDTDESLQRKTMDLLIRMTTSKNVEFVVDRLIRSVTSTSDEHFKGELVSRIVTCAERFAPSPLWFVKIIIQLFEIAGDKIKPNVGQTLMQLIAEGSPTDETDKENSTDIENDPLRTEVVADFLRLITKPSVPAIIAKTAAWVLGEYGYLARCGPDNVKSMLTEMAEKSTDPNTKAHVVTALLKLTASCGRPNDLEYLERVETSSHKRSLDLQQRCSEFRALFDYLESSRPATRSVLLQSLLPVDASCEDLDVDPTLPFLTDFVSAALLNGAAPYRPKRAERVEALANEADTGKSRQRSAGLRLTPYDAPPPPPQHPLVDLSPVTEVAVTSALPGYSTTPLVPQQQHQQTTSSASELSPSIATVALSSTAIVPGNNLLLASASKSGGVVWGRTTRLAAPVSIPQPDSPQVQNSTIDTSTVPSSSVPISSKTSISTVQSISQINNSPNQPRELTEREKMAQALFGGTGNGSSVTNTNTKLGNVSTTSSTSTMNRVPTKLTSTSTAQVLATDKSVTANDSTSSNKTSSLLDFEGLIVSPSLSCNSSIPASTLLSTVLSTTVLPSDDILPISSASTHLFADINTVGIHSQENNIPCDVLGTIPSHVAPIDLMTDVLLDVHYSTGIDSSTLLQKTSTDKDLISTATTTTTATATTTASATTTETTTTTISTSIATKDISAAFEGLNLSIPIPPSVMSGSTTTTTTTSGTATLKTSILDHITPVILTTPEFGQQWGTLRQERKRAASVAVLTVQDLSTALPSSFYLVEAIIATKEAIYAGSLSSTSISGRVTESIVLLHVRLGTPKPITNTTVGTNISSVATGIPRLNCELTVRTSERDTSNAILDAIYKYTQA